LLLHPRLTLASLGWDVLATDIPKVISTVLSRNIAQNTAVLPIDSGTIAIRELDWTVPPEQWQWDNSNAIASSDSTRPSFISGPSRSEKPLGPPFDLVVTSDTIYSPELTQPLLRTLHALCYASIAAPALSARSPPVYLCIERRDPSLIDSALSEAQSVWGFDVTRIPHKRISKAMVKGGVKWDKEDWEGIEIWKMTLSGR
jgi:hypothetical protein